MIRYTWILAGALFLFSCSQQEKGFTVSGKLENADGKKIWLHEMTSRDLLPVDSAIIDTTGNFTLSGASDEVRFYSVHASAGDYVYLLTKTGEDVIITGDANDLDGTYVISGSEESGLIRELTLEQNRTLEKISRLTRTFNDSIESPDFERIKAGLDSTYREIVDAQRYYTFRFIEENLNSQASLMALYQQIGPRYNLLNTLDDFRYYSMVDSSLYNLYPESDAVKDLHRQVEELKQRMQMEAAAAARFSNGMEVPDIALPNPDGDTIVLSSLRGKVVLLDFWASWCEPCRKESPNLVQNYEKYRDKGFEIYQVSLDRTRAAWLKGISDDKLDWIQVSDLQYWNSIVVPIYNIQGIPMNFLLDRDGKIIAQSLRGDLLGAKLEEIFRQ